MIELMLRVIFYHVINEQYIMIQSKIGSKYLFSIMI